MATSSSAHWLWVILTTGLLVGLGVGGYFYFDQSESGEPITPPPAQPPETPEDIVAQVHYFCGACHAYPPAETFPREHWRKEVERGYRFFEQSGMPLKPPPVESVVQYYEERAPEELAVPHWKSAPGELGIDFEKLSYPGPKLSEPFAISNVNLVHLPDPTRPVPEGDTPRVDILACDMRAGLVMILRPYESNPTWKVLAEVSNPAHAEVIDLDRDGLKDIIVANLGSFPPTDRKCGSVVWLKGHADGTFTSTTLLEDVGRVADVQAADFRGTGQLDLVVGVFGWQTAGKVIVLDNHTTDWNNPMFKPRVVDHRHGAIHVPVTDLNEDGRPDFIALMGQEFESVDAFLNQGDGEFEKKQLYAAPHPGYGNSGIQLIDFNGDGKQDILYTNGDILDEPYLFKPYHSVQWLENKGNLEFEHHSLTPMFGVHRAVAGDMDGNGLTDVIAVSFLPEDKFPDRREREADAIVMLKQVAPGQFERHTLAINDCDHVTCAVGDLYGTGRLDLVLGHFSSVSTDVPVTIWKNLGKEK